MKSALLAENTQDFLRPRGLILGSGRDPCFYFGDNAEKAKAAGRAVGEGLWGKIPRIFSFYTS